MDNDISPCQFQKSRESKNMTLKQKNQKYGEHPNFAKIKFVVGASRSLVPVSEQDARTTEKINLHIWDAPEI